MNWFSKELDSAESVGDAFRVACLHRSDIYEHCPALKRLAEQCGSVVEFGVREGVSTVALLSGRPVRMLSVDLHVPPKQHRISQLAALAGVGWNFIQSNTLQIEIDPCDLLFIDTRHTYRHLSQELELHGGKASRVAIHDTESFARHSDFGEGKPGLMDAIEEYALRSGRVIESIDRRCNGLTVIR